MAPLINTNMANKVGLVLGSFDLSHNLTQILFYFVVIIFTGASFDLSVN